MSGINVRQTAREFLATVDDLKSREMPRAISMALNRAADGVRVDASREIRTRYKIKVATVNKAFSIQRATPSRLVSMIRVRGRPLSLGGFSARQVRKGVTVNVKGTRKLITHAFVRTLRTNDDDTYEVVFMRVGKTRYPLKALKTVDIPGLFVLEDINAKVRALAFDRFETELRSAVRAITARA
jgi:hypothetical protein